MSKLVRGIVDRFEEARERLLPTLDEASEAAAKILQREVVARVPVKTGKLRAFFASPAAISKSWKYQHAYVYGLTKELLRGDAYYAVFVEYGTKGYTRGSTRSWTTKGGKVKTKKVTRAVPARPAHPFFRPAVDAARARIKGTIVERVKQALKD